MMLISGMNSNDDYQALSNKQQEYAQIPGFNEINGMIQEGTQKLSEAMQNITDESLGKEPD